MKNYKQILEAINRGIQLALDNIEDDEPNSSLSQKSDIIDSEDVIKQKYEFNKLIKKFELEQQTAGDILRLGELSKITGLKYKISKERLYNFIRNYLIWTESLYHANLNWIDTSEIYTMEKLFYESKFDGDISEWDVSNVENMSQMFYCSWFEGDISNWDVSNVESMHGMFQYTSFNSDISKWNVSKCRDFKNMFMNDTIFCQDLSNWEIKKGSDTNMMFWGTKIVTYDNYIPQFV